MSFPLPFLCLSLALLSTTPVAAFSQDQTDTSATSVEAPVADTSGTETISPQEIAFNERAAALGQRVIEFDAKLKDAARRATGDSGASSPELDSLQAQFQAEIDAFIEDFIAFASWKEQSLTPEARDDQRRGVESMVSQLAAVPQSLRDLAQASVQPSATP